MFYYNNRELCYNNLQLNISKMVKPKTIEKEKVVAEKLNGRFAMIGFIAAIGAYLTTGQIIPGIV